MHLFLNFSLFYLLRSIDKYGLLVKVVQKIQMKPVAKKYLEKHWRFNQKEAAEAELVPFLRLTILFLLRY